MIVTVYQVLIILVLFAALRIFLNGEAGFHRPVLIQMLASLWRILHWCRNQRKLRIYSSSVLLVYDARMLRFQNKTNGFETSVHSSLDKLPRYKLNRPLSLATNRAANDDIKATRPGFSGQFTSDGPKFERSLSANNADVTFNSESINSHWKQTFRKLQRNHSFCNNYEEDLKNLKKDYVYMLDDLVGNHSNICVNVKMIDFAHVFPSESNTVDTNYLEGIENLIKILENFLEECK